MNDNLDRNAIQVPLVDSAGLQFNPHVISSSKCVDGNYDWQFRSQIRAVYTNEKQ